MAQAEGKGKECVSCGVWTPPDGFYPSISACKACHRKRKKAWRAKNRAKHRATHSAWGRRNARGKQATRLWHRLPTPYAREREAIFEFYVNTPDGFEVDHQIPLRGGTVSGLHVLANLQYLTPTANSLKGNRWWSEEVQFDAPTALAPSPGPP